MSDTNIENQLHLADRELNRQIAPREEKLLQESEKRYRRLFESAQDGILILDAGTGRVVDVNPFLLRLLGYSYDALCGQYIWDIGVLKDIAASKDAFKTLRENDYIRYEDLPLETIDGRSIAVEFVSNVYLVDDIKVIQCNIRDITARKRTERALAESEAKMRGILDNIGIGVTLISPGMEVADDGRITIETRNAVFNETYCAHRAGFVAGEYGLIAVSDDGCGMDKEVLEQIFEPFFTSKEAGHGTGLGLSTVYGIVKQNNGFINVYSEPGKGTTFRIYLLRHTGQALDTQRDRAEKIPLSRGETVLLVEDEPALMTMTQNMLEGLRYRVPAAGTPTEALELAEQHAGEIQLLITDVVMPKMNGRDLAERRNRLREIQRVGKDCEKWVER